MVSSRTLRLLLFFFSSETGGMFCRAFLPYAFSRSFSFFCCLFLRTFYRPVVFPRFVLLVMFCLHEFHFFKFCVLMIFTIISNLCIFSSLEIAYFNPNTKDVIPGVSPQILQIKVQRRFHCILTYFKNATVNTTRLIEPNLFYQVRP